MPLVFIVLYVSHSNEFYARDTSKKIKSVFQAKGRAGKHVTSDPPYGCLKDKDDPTKWVVDEEAAVVIRRIFQMTLDGMGPPHPLTGLVFCADCGCRLYLHRVNNNKPVPKFVCGNYPSKKCASGHRIDADDLLHLVSQTLQAIKEYSDDSPDAFARMVQALAGNKQSEELRVKKHLLQEKRNRRDELERLICRAYEEHTQGALPDRRYEIINSQYETELAALEQEIPELEASIENFESGDANAQQFIELVKKYDSFENLDTAMCNELIEKILVHERDKKGSISSTQRVDIYFNFIGTFTPPLVEIDPEKEAAEAKAAEKEAAWKEKLHQNYLKRKASGKQREYEERYKARRQERMAELKAELPPSPGVPMSEYHAAKNTTKGRTTTAPDSVTPLYDDAIAV